MDYEDIIKLEEQSPIYSTGNNSHGLKQCMAAFYDNDSEFDQREPCQLIHDNYHISFEQAIDYVQNYVDIIDTPLDDIILCLDRLQCAQDLDRMVLKRKILKRKNLLKRYRAKNRQAKIVFSYEQFPIFSSTNGVETEAQIKKKRNRVSAQISRDRKKQCFRELEQKNKKLQEQIMRAMIENQKLKKQIENTESQPKSTLFPQILSSKLTKLLVLLGIICLIGMLKQTFISTGQSHSRYKATDKIDQISQFSLAEHSKMIEEGRLKVTQFLEDIQLEEQLLDIQDNKVSSNAKLSIPERNMSKRHIFQGLIQKINDIKKISYKIKN